MSGSSVEARSFQVVAPTANRSGGQLPTLTLYKPDGTPFPIPQKQAAQADSVAADVPTLKTDFNSLLAKLRLAGIIA